MSMLMSSQMCERCKNEAAIYNCSTCHPFHSFCQRCDSIVHSLPLKSTHSRSTLTMNTMTMMGNTNTNMNMNMNQANSAIKSSTFNNQIPQEQYQPISNTNTNIYPIVNNSQTNMNPINMSSTNINTNINNINPNMTNIPNQNQLYNNSKTNFNSTNYYNNNDISPNIDPQSSLSTNTFTREYVTELRKLNEKEKGELRYKLNSLQNNLSRLKLSFQTEMQKLQDESNLTEQRGRQKEADLINNYEQLIVEKNNKINSLLSTIEEFKKKNKILSSQSEENRINQKENSDLSNKKISNLHQEIIKLNEENKFIDKDGKNKYESILRNNDEQINNVNLKYKKDINDLVYNGKVMEEKLSKSIENNNNFLNKLRADNANLEEENNKLKNENGYLAQELEKLKAENEGLSVDLNDAKQNNELLSKSYNELKGNNNKIESDFEKLDKGLQLLKQEMNIVKDSNCKKDNDFQNLLNQSEKLRKIFTDNIFYNENMDKNNRLIACENEKLRNQLNMFLRKTNMSKQSNSVKNNSNYNSLTYEMK